MSAYTCSRVTPSVRRSAIYSIASSVVSLLACSAGSSSVLASEASAFGSEISSSQLAGCSAKNLISDGLRRRALIAFSSVHDTLVINSPVLNPKDNSTPALSLNFVSCMISSLFFSDT